MDRGLECFRDRYFAKGEGGGTPPVASQCFSATTGVLHLFVLGGPKVRDLVRYLKPVDQSIRTTGKLIL
jgi:hypothetical protein